MVKIIINNNSDIFSNNFILHDIVTISEGKRLSLAI